MKKMKGVNKQKEYRIYIRSNEHPRTINTPMMFRAYYSIITVVGTFEDMITKVKELKAQGEFIYEVRSGLNGQWFF
jgi:hypothetical protein